MDWIGSTDVSGLRKKNMFTFCEFNSLITVDMI